MSFSGRRSSASSRRRPSETFWQSEIQGMTSLTSKELSEREVFHKDELEEDDEAEINGKDTYSSARRNRSGFLRDLALTKAAPATNFPVALVGAGNVVFGSDEGPWNLSARLEVRVGRGLKVTAVIDPNVDRARESVNAKLGTEVESAYRDTKIFATIDDFLNATKRPQWPKAIVIGSPPAFRGSDEAGKDAEIKLLDAMPGVSLFVEKPVSTSAVEAARRVATFMEERRDIVCVGYFLRYTKVVQKLKRIIDVNQLKVTHTIAIYSASYEKIAKPAWWDKSKDKGPVVEQGTHFCDLSRYFGGDVDLDTIQAHAVEYDEKVGELGVIPVDESVIKETERIPRVTSANWKYKNGAVGTLVHSAVLRGTKYATELQVYADGFLFRILDLYHNPRLTVRRPDSDAEEVFTYPGDDPYQSEMTAFIDACEAGVENAKFLSTYDDSVSTYEFTWAIRHASERTTEERRKRQASKPAVAQATTTKSKAKVVPYDSAILDEEDDQAKPRTAFPSVINSLTNKVKDLTT